MDLVTAASNPSVDLKSIWEDYETKLMLQDSELKFLFYSKNLNDFYKRLNQKIITKLELFVRALVRQFTLGNLGSEAKTYTGIISKLLFLSDEDLGKSNYGS